MTMQISDLLDLISFNSWLFYMTQYFLEPVITVILCLLSVFVVLGNMLVVSAIWHENQLHSVTNYLIASLAAADCLVGAIVMPFCIISEVILGSWTFGPLWCDLYHSFDVLASTASIMNLCAISLDRYTAITNPIKYPRRMTPKRVALLIAFLWTCSSLISFPAILWWRAVSESPLQRIPSSTSIETNQAQAQALTLTLAQTQTQHHSSGAVSSPTLSPPEHPHQELSDVRLEHMTNQTSSLSRAIKTWQPTTGETSQVANQTSELVSPLIRPTTSFATKSHTSQAGSSSFLAGSSPSRLSSSLSFPLLASSSTLRLNNNSLQDNDVKYRCVFTNDTYYLLFSSFVSFYGPLCVMLYAYYRIYKAAVQQTRFLQHGSKQVMIGKNKRSRRSKLKNLNEVQHTGEYGSRRMDSNPNSCDKSQTRLDEANQGHHLVLRAHRGGTARARVTSTSVNSDTGSANNSRPTLSNPSNQQHQKPLKTTTSSVRRITKQQQNSKTPSTSMLPLIYPNSDTNTDSSLKCNKTRLKLDTEMKVESVTNEELNGQLNETIEWQPGGVGSPPVEHRLNNECERLTPQPSTSTDRANVPAELIPGGPSTQETRYEHFNWSKGCLIENKSRLEQTARLKKTLSFKKGTLGTETDLGDSSTSSKIVRLDGSSSCCSLEHKQTDMELGGCSELVCSQLERAEIHQASQAKQTTTESGSCRGQLIYYSEQEKSREVLHGLVDLTGMHYIDCSSYPLKTGCQEHSAGGSFSSPKVRDMEGNEADMSNVDKSNNITTTITNTTVAVTSTSTNTNANTNSATTTDQTESSLTKSLALAASDNKLPNAQSISCQDLHNKEPTSGPKTLSMSSVASLAENGPARELAASGSGGGCETALSNVGPSGGGANAEMSTPLNVQAQSKSVGRKLTKLAKERKAAKTLGIVVGVFILCWLPFFVVNIIVALCGTSCIYKPHILMSIVTWLGWLNSAMNPVIYACWSRDFRRAFRRVLCSWVEFLCPYDGSNIARKLNLKKSSNYSPQEVYLNRTMSSIKGNTSTVTMRSATGQSTSTQAGCISQLANGIGGAPVGECLQGSSNTTPPELESVKVVGSGETSGPEPRGGNASENVIHYQYTAKRSSPGEAREAGALLQQGLPSASPGEPTSSINSRQTGDGIGSSRATAISSPELQATRASYGLMNGDIHRGDLLSSSAGLM